MKPHVSIFHLQQFMAYLISQLSPPLDNDIENLFPKVRSLIDPRRQHGQGDQLSAEALG